MAMFEEMKFVNFRKFETELAGRPLVVETGKMAQLAGGSCLIRYGETEVLCNATASAKPREGVDFFPLSVDFEEKLYLPESPEHEDLQLRYKIFQDLPHRYKALLKNFDFHKFR